MPNAETLFAALRGQPFHQSKFKRLDSAPGLRAAFERTPHPRTEPESIDLGALHEAHQHDRIVELSRQRKFLAAEIERGERNGVGEGPSQAMDRRKIGELWASWRSTSDETERGRIVNEILKLTASAKPNKLAAAKRELNRVDREIDEAVEGSDAPARGSLVKVMERRRREFEASRRPANKKIGVDHYGPIAGGRFQPPVMR